ADHVHTDIVAHSHNGFPVRTGDEFLAFLRAVADNGPDASDPLPIAAFLATHPAAKAFVEAPEADPGELRPAGVLRRHRLQVHQPWWRQPVRPVPPAAGGGDCVPPPRGGRGEAD